ncbi:MAG: PIG-L family deacetylase [Candidatus Omnitrophica bacterium]|nr:PIG-L family deacetylase [Candidatus Omnitrophota bacterium]MDD5430480.1 PIG-L family deacetylase [Candidatus Omnitrophota bacterium]
MLKKNIYFLILVLILSGCMKPVDTGRFCDNGDLRRSIQSGKKIMIIEPHSDDEIFIAGTIAYACGQQDNECYVLNLGTISDFLNESQIALREKTIKWMNEEYLQGYINLNNSWRNVFGWGMGKADIEKIKPQLKEAIEEKKPGIILTFSPYGYEGHQNHKATSAMVSEIYDELSYKPEVYYFINVFPQFSEYKKYPPTDIIDLKAYSKDPENPLLDAKLKILEEYSDTVPFLKNILKDKDNPKVEENTYIKEYFRRVK